MSLGNKQKDFTLLVAELIFWCYENDYKLTFGDAYRDPRLHGQIGEKVGYGHKNSNHKRRLAIDLNLFKGGKYQTKTSDYKEVGEHWESLDDRCRWGGRFQDGNHFSFEHQGHM